MQEFVYRNGRPVAGFGLGSMPQAAWVEARNKLQDTDRLVATGQGGALVEWDGAKRTALETTQLLRRQMSAGLGSVVVGVGHPEPPSPTMPQHPSPWKYAVVMSLVSAATGWALEGIARTFRKKKKERR